MRAALIGLALVAGCSPDIISGAYLCGPEQACPEGQVCNGPDNTCVVPSMATPYSCLADSHDTMDTALQLPTQDCVSTPHIERDCLAKDDAQDWLEFHVMPVCQSKVELQLTYPIAFEPLALELWGAGSMIAADSECAAPVPAGYEARCITMPVNADADYAIAVKPAGGGDCDGACAYNRYDLTIQMASR